MIPYCIECGKDFMNGKMLFHPLVYLFAPSTKQFICRKCAEGELMSKCRDCGRTFLHGDLIIYGALGCYCANRLNCFNKRKNMVETKQLKITAEVDGKQVPLNTISTESFEAIKALEKPKEIPVARVGNYQNEPESQRLFLKITDSVRDRVANSDTDVIAIDLRSGNIQNSWPKGKDPENFDNFYENIKPL